MCAHQIRPLYSSQRGNLIMNPKKSGKICFVKTQSDLHNTSAPCRPHKVYYGTLRLVLLRGSAQARGDPHREEDAQLQDLLCLPEHERRP